MTTFDFAKVVDVGAVKAGLQSRPDEGRGTREAAAMTYEELLAECHRQERAAYEAGRVHGKRRQTVKAAKDYSEAITWHEAARLLDLTLKAEKEENP